MSKKSKRPKHQGEPRDRQIQQRVDPENANKLTPLWSFALLDIEGSWRENNARGISAQLLLSDVLPKLKNRESMTWTEILQETHGKTGKSKNHAVSIAKIIKEANERLTQLKLEDIDELFSLRLQGKHRVWGIREGRILKIIWLDEDHTVYPSLRE